VLRFPAAFHSSLGQRSHQQQHRYGNQVGIKVSLKAVLARPETKLLEDPEVQTSVEFLLSGRLLHYGGGPAVTLSNTSLPLDPLVIAVVREDTVGVLDSLWGEMGQLDSRVHDRRPLSAENFPVSLVGRS